MVVVNPQNAQGLDSGDQLAADVYCGVGCRVRWSSSGPVSENEEGRFRWGT